MNAANETRPSSLLFQRCVASVIALTFSIGAVWLALDVARAERLIPIAPFGWYRMIVIHAIAALPLSWLIGSLVPNRRIVAPFLLMIGITAAMATVWFGNGMGAVLHHGQSGFLVRHLARVLLVYCLVAGALVRVLRCRVR